MSQYRLLKGAKIINEGLSQVADILIKGRRIERIDRDISHPKAEIIEVDGKWIIPGVIDDQVHFREPGLTHKASIYTESCAAAAGGVTSFMEMPNVRPASLSQELLEEKYALASELSAVNYSFFMGASNENIEEVLRTPPDRVCGVKVFMGSSTGNMLVDEEVVLEQLFSRVDTLIATHCEDESIIRARSAQYRERYGELIPWSAHPEIRNHEACIQSSEKAIGLARRYGTRLHILHISTAQEVELFDRNIPLRDKLITAEACVHHLSLTDADYDRLGSRMKCNPAIKTAHDQAAIWNGLHTGSIDIIATDHAPHTVLEKSGHYFKAPSGLPLIQHSLLLILQAVDAGRLSVEEMVHWMCHAPAECFRIKERGYLREGYYADIVCIDPMGQTSVDSEGLFYKCGWSPWQGQLFNYRIQSTWVNGHLVYTNNQSRIRPGFGMRLSFDSIRK